MDQRAQSGMDYLLTYGWAIVLLIAVVSVLFFVAVPPENRFSCKSTEPKQVIVESYAFPFSGNSTSLCGDSDCEIWGLAEDRNNEGKIVIQNGMSTKISVVGIDYSLFSENIGNCTYELGLVPKNANGLKIEDLNPSIPINIFPGGRLNITGIVFSRKAYPASKNCRISDFQFSPATFLTIRHRDESGTEKPVTIICAGYPPKV